MGQNFGSILNSVYYISVKFHDLLLCFWVSNDSLSRAVSLQNAIGVL
jgi:hypothetical protein